MSDDANLATLHRRYLIQAAWTAENRQRMFDSANLDAAASVLEVGSGTGVITADLARYVSAHVVGIDVDVPAARFARSQDPESDYGVADGVWLPFSNDTFGATICHFLLLWVRDARAVISEMARVTVGSGSVLALAEPDYGGRIDYPEELAAVGELQAHALAKRGADPRIGRKLQELFTQVGLREVQSGVLGGIWTAAPSQERLQSEWQTLADDLAGHMTPERLQELQRKDRQAWQYGSRVLFVPTFFASGRVP